MHIMHTYMQICIYIHIYKHVHGCHMYVYTYTYIYTCTYTHIYTHTKINTNTKQMVGAIRHGVCTFSWFPNSECFFSCFGGILLDFNTPERRYEYTARAFVTSLRRPSSEMSLQLVRSETCKCVVCCSVLQCVAVCCNLFALRPVNAWCVAVCCSVLQCVAACSL